MAAPQETLTSTPPSVRSCTARRATKRAAVRLRSSITPTYDVDGGIGEVAEVEGGAGVADHAGQPAELAGRLEEGVDQATGSVTSARHGRAAHPGPWSPRSSEELLGALPAGAVADHDVVARGGEAAHGRRADAPAAAR